MRKMILSVLLLAAFTGAIAQPTPPPIEDRRYEDYYTFKYGKSYSHDPWTWGYTREFAEKFRMPEKWIEPELKGVLAVAFRMTTVGWATCGLGGKEDNCWPPLECQLDVYYDNTTNLPWTREAIIRDFEMTGISSREYTGGEFGRVRQQQRKYPMPARNVVPGIGVQNSLIIDEKHGGGPTRVAYYDKELAPGVALIGYVGSVCPSLVGVGRLTFRSQEVSVQIMNREVGRKEAPVMHIMEFPVSFMRRANVAYERDNKPNQAVTDRLIRQFMDSRK